MSQRLASEILQIFRQHGDQSYGEAMSVNSHSVQAGWLAKEKGYSEELQLAAFLHDIGHLIPLSADEKDMAMMGQYGVEQHDLIGEEYLAHRGFSPLIRACVRNHVAAKRYLCAKEPGYFETLSEASLATLAHQGGPMTEEQCAAFERDPHFEASIRIRRLDELAKEADYLITEDHWAYFTGLLDRLAAQ